MVYMLEDKEDKTKFSRRILSVSYEATQVEDSKNKVWYLNNIEFVI